MVHCEIESIFSFPSLFWKTKSKSGIQIAITFLIIGIFWSGFQRFALWYNLFHFNSFLKPFHMIFKGGNKESIYLSFKTVKMSSIFHQPCIYTLFWDRNKLIRFWWTRPYVQGHHFTWKFQVLTEIVYVHALPWNNWLILAILYISYHCDTIKGWL